jgi:tight adherence protein B
MTTIAVAIIGGGASAWLARRARRIAVLDRIRVGHERHLPSWIRSQLERMLDDAAIDSQPEVIVQMWLLSALVAGLLALSLGPQLALVGVVAVLVGGPVVLHALRHRRARAITAAVPDTLERVAAELRAGGTVATAIAWLATDGGPLAVDFTRLQSRVELGASIPDALAGWAHERNAAGTASAAGALAVAHEVGGRSADALDSLATSLRERLGVVAESHALSAQARYSALVVGLGPLVYLAFSFVVDRRTAETLLGTNLGRVCVLAGVALELGGAAWMRRILDSGAIA